MGQGGDLTKDQIISLYNAIGAAETSFNSVQNSYRLLASTWLIGCFAGIGFTLDKKPVLPRLSTEVMCAAIGFTGAIAIFLLWLMDICVYQRLLTLNFSRGLKLEEDNTWLPQIRRDIMEKFKGNLPRMTSIFYAAMLFILWSVGVIFVGFGLTGPVKLWIPILMEIIGIALAAFVVESPWSSGADATL
jgi:hypothetical protein